MNVEKSSLNPSSLLDLKAELHKKYDLFRRAKSSQKSDSRKQTTLKHKGESVTKDKKVTLKHVLNVNVESNEEELALKKSREALEAKAKFYEKITSNNILIDDEDNEKYLVDFHRKVLYDTSMPVKAEINSNSTCSEENHETFHSSKLPKDIYDKSHQSDRMSEENQTEQSVHYQNVQFNEVRDHGTGYFAFSMDESKRKEQMEELNRLRGQTEEQRIATQKLQRKRKAKLEARLAKVCERRNIDKSVVQMYTKMQESDDASPVQSVDLSSIPLPETSEVPVKKEVKIRPWDIGKTDFPSFVPEKSKIRSQNDWIKERRSQRPSEFAPPSSYS